jgi:hypothetical protein
MIHDLTLCLQKQISIIYPARKIGLSGGIHKRCGVSLVGPDRGFDRGCRALTTMLIFGRKSASYCTHKAATAAICFQHTPIKM